MTMPQPIQVPSEHRYSKSAAPRPPDIEPIIRLENLEKFFGSNHVLRGCSLEVYPRETICLIGRHHNGREAPP